MSKEEAPACAPLLFFSERVSPDSYPREDIGPADAACPVLASAFATSVRRPRPGGLVGYLAGAG
jgi:hypothetical protein